MRVVQVDAFAARPFEGNPAAVCLLDGARPDDWLCAVAAEMNLSETAFISPATRGTFGLRWFTPRVEVELCGHATLASAHVLWEDGVVERTEPVRFATRSGELVAAWHGGLIEMDFPADPARQLPAGAVPAPLMAGLGPDVRPHWVGRNRFDYLVVLDSATAVRRLAPDFGVLSRVETRGVIVTAPADADVPAQRSPRGPIVRPDFVSRWFGPRVGVPEDPVTGSAHCCLGPFWADRLGRTTVTGYQASARGGHVGVRVLADRVTLTGQAVTVLAGELRA
jgi:predicted PhzF superfamily epimerase YddE/YHI9